MWPKEQLLIMSNFTFGHNLFKSCFLRSSFSFCHNVYSSIQCIYFHLQIFSMFIAKMFPKSSAADLLFLGKVWTPGWPGATLDNTFPHKNVLWCLCSRQLLKTLWQKEKLIKTICCRFAVCGKGIILLLRKNSDCLAVVYLPSLLKHKSFKSLLTLSLPNFTKSTHPWWRLDY